MRLSQVEWHHPGDVFLSLEPEGTIIYRTVRALAELMPGAKFEVQANEADMPHVVAFGTRDSLSRLTGRERMVFCLESGLDPLPSTHTQVFRGHVDADTELLLSTEVPDPPMPENEQGGQLGKKAGSLGRLLPGFKIESNAGDLVLGGLLPKEDSTITIPGVKLDGDGFLVPR